MKKILMTSLIVLMAISCDRDLEFETISKTEPAVEIQVEGLAVNNTLPKIEGAKVDLHNEDGILLATATTNDKGRVLFTKEQLKEKGIFTFKASKGDLVGSYTSKYLLLNDGVALFIITIAKAP